MTGRRALTPLKRVELVLAILPATILACFLVILGSAAVGGLLFAAAAHILQTDRAGLVLALKVLAWLGGSMAGAAWGTAALWLATVSNERDLRNSPRLRWSIVLGLMLGLADAGYWLGSKYSLRDSPLYAYALVMASLAGLGNLIVTLRVPRSRE